MSHTWSGFGLLLCATVLHTTALTIRMERIKGRANKRAILQELYLIGSECCLSWVAVISALRVVISPRNSLPTCHLSESLASTFMLVIWALHFIALGNTTKGKDQGHLIEYPTIYIGGLLFFFFSIAIVSTVVSSSTGRIGMLCFFEASWLHLFLHVWFFRNVLVRLRYGIQSASNSGSERGMERVIDEEHRGLSPEAQKTVASAIISMASLAILIVYNLPGIIVDGGLVFWEFWLALSGATSLAQEWGYAE